MPNVGNLILLDRQEYREFSLKRKQKKVEKKKEKISSNKKRRKKRRKKKRSVSSPVPWKMQWPNS